MQGFESWRDAEIDSIWAVANDPDWRKRLMGLSAEITKPTTITSIKPVEKPYFICPGEAPTIRLLPPSKNQPYMATRTHTIKRRMKTFQNWCFENALGCP